MGFEDQTQDAPKLERVPNKSLDNARSANEELQRCANSPKVNNNLNGCGLNTRCQQLANNQQPKGTSANGPGAKNIVGGYMK